MIIKVVELLENDQYTEYNDKGTITKKTKRYALVENFLNVSKIVSFREIDSSRYEKDSLPSDLDPSQQFTYISIANTNRGVVVVDSPESLQEKINKISLLSSSSKNILRG